ncbi:cytochrome P450 [Crassisporium funariophilum]|nr:cytochrome P450 [Crassisporium funariophilum]
MDVEGSGSSMIFVVLGVVMAFTLLAWSERSEPNLKHIPTAGRSGYLLSYIDAFLGLWNGPAQLQKGYEKYGPGIFKIANLNRWVVVIAGTQYIEELRKAPEDEVSFGEAAKELASSPHYLGQTHPVSANGLGDLATHLTRNLPFILAGIREEIGIAVKEATPPAENPLDWIEVDAFNWVSQIIVKVNNRVFVGLPLCRDPEFTSSSLSILKEIYQTGPFRSLLPNSIRSIIERISSGSLGSRRRLRKRVASFIKERKVASEERQESFEQKNNDLISWILHGITNKNAVNDTANNLVALSLSANQILLTNLMHVLYHLAANPEYAAPLRTEIESAVVREGWTKSALEKMRKLDSLIKESMRISGTSSLTMMRKTLKPYTFSSNTHIPPQTLLFAASLPRHLSPTIYPSPLFSPLHEQQHSTSPSPTSTSASEGGTRFGLVATTPDWLAWGYGRHACPGRFYGAAVVKVVLAWVVLGFDVRFEFEGGRPGDVVFGMGRLPNPDVKIMLRKR